MSFKERRRAPRIEASLAITISGGPEEAEGKTINISSNGVLLESPRRIEPLTKVRMGFIVPAQKGSRDIKSQITFDGVVVRVEPEEKDATVPSYRIAVFFTYVSKSSQQALDNYIMHRLST